MFHIYIIGLYVIKHIIVVPDRLDLENLYFVLVGKFMNLAL